MFIHLEAVHLTAGIFDTNDLATIRGSSLILEQMGPRAAEALGLELVRGGGSKALLKTAQDDPTLPDRIEAFLNAEPYRFFVMTWGTGADEAAARQDAKIRQLGRWSVPRLAPDELWANSNDAVDPLDGFRPALAQGWYQGDEIALSPSVKCRRAEGSEARPELFQHNGWLPPKSFEDIVYTRDAARVPFVVRNKLALVTADGMGFGALLKDEGDAFLARLDSFREELAQQIEDWAGERGLWYPDKSGGSDVLRHRVDVLLWGGDDVTFVLPASHVFDFLKMFFACTEKAGLPHRAACVIAQYKTPIRKMMSLATAAEHALKDSMAARNVSGQDAFSIDVFESSPIPFEGPTAYRTSLYGKTYAQGDDMFLATDLDRIFAYFKAGKDGSAQAGATLSSTQTFRILQQLLGEQRNFPGRKPEDDKKAREAVAQAEALVQEHFDRVHNTAVKVKAMRTALSSLSRMLPMHLAQASILGPYVEASLNAQYGADWSGTDAAV